VVSASPEGVSKIWDLKGGKTAFELRGHTKKVNFIRLKIISVTGQHTTHKELMLLHVVVTGSCCTGI
jgi:WD40 repeat protein